MTSRRSARRSPRPYLELRWGGVHLVVERVPYRLLAAIGGAVSALGGAAWFGQG